MMEVSSISKKGFIIYGEPAVGKSTLELNLREIYLGTALSTDNYSCDGVHCFLGKTAKSHNRVMATSGAEVIKSLDFPDVEWYIASLPTAKTDGIKIFMKLLPSLDYIVVLSLHSENREEYYRNRVRYFSKRDAIFSIGKAKLRIPEFDFNICSVFETEDLKSAINFSISVLGPKSDGSFPKFVSSFKLLEEFDNEEI